MSRFSTLVLVIFFSIAIVAVESALPVKFFDVRKYGAVGDGKTDNTKAFLNTWKDACEYYGRSRMWIPYGTFLLGSVTFAGPCKGSLSFIIKGTIKAPTDPKQFFTDTWIGFQYIRDLTVKGGGYLDGQGEAAWPYNDCGKKTQCTTLPVTMRFDFVNDSRVHHVRSINSKSSHFNVFACVNLNISQVRLTAPAESPNTDGIHIGNSSNIKISRSIIGTGDDCISMVAGSQNIDIWDVTCGPGHGISVGSLGKTHVHEYVTNIKVRNCTFIGSDNGVRIKTWGSPLYSLASGILFQNIIMKNVKNPIFIDQSYCPYPNCYPEMESGVQIEDVTFRNIWGVSDTEVAVNLQCSRSTPCKNVKFINIDLAYSGPGGKSTSQCENVYGSSYGKLVPGGCL